MPSPKEDKKREERITDNIVVDAYGEDERALGWYCYLEERIAFPFTGECIEKRGISPLRKGEQVEVVGMSKENDCLNEMFIQINWQGREMGIPLAQIKPLKVNKDTKEAIEDWHYWVMMGYMF
ncbi:MAG: calcium-binding protein [Anaerolineales bacterium]